MKKIVKIFAMGIIFISMIVNTVSASEIQVTLNNQYLSFDQSPTMINNRTMVPMRSIFEALGAYVDWNQSSRTVTATWSDGAITMQIGSSVAERTYTTGDSNTYYFDTPSEIINNRTFVPVRFVSETFGAYVEWDGSNSIVKIYMNDALRNINKIDCPVYHELDTNGNINGTYQKAESALTNLLSQYGFPIPDISVSNGYYERRRVQTYELLKYYTQNVLSGCENICDKSIKYAERYFNENFTLRSVSYDEAIGWLISTNWHDTWGCTVEVNGNGEVMGMHESNETLYNKLH